MSIRAVVQLLVRRWWVIVLVTGIALGGAFGYSWRQQRTYQASASLYVHPSAALTNPRDSLSQLSVLSYGSVLNTFVSLAQSRSMLVQATATLDPPPDRLDLYSAVATVLPRTTVLNLSVTGPNSQAVIVLANSLSTSVAGVVDQNFPSVTVTSVDRASTSTLVRPRTAQNLLYGGLAGLIVGVVAAGLSLYLPPLVAAVRAEADDARAIAVPRRSGPLRRKHPDDPSPTSEQLEPNGQELGSPRAMAVDADPPSTRLS